MPVPISLLLPSWLHDCCTTYSAVRHSGTLVLRDVVGPNIWSHGSLLGPSLCVQMNLLAVTLPGASCATSGQAVRQPSAATFLSNRSKRPCPRSLGRNTHLTQLALFPFLSRFRKTVDGNNPSTIGRSDGSDRYCFCTTGRRIFGNNHDRIIDGTPIPNLVIDLSSTNGRFRLLSVFDCTALRLIAHRLDCAFATTGRRRASSSSSWRTCRRRRRRRRCRCRLRPSAFGLRPSAFGLWPLAFGLRPSAFGIRPSAFGLRR
jgi:hypothetical protein